MMFGFTGADDIETVTRKKGYMAEAQAHWPFLTHFDASTIENERQFVAIVKERSSVSQQDAEADVRQWMQNKAF
jgi:ABC-type proline/glycine betaine transport system substrate-binding protein